MKNITTSDVKREIERIEYYSKGLFRSGAEVKVSNVRVRKTKPITADITILDGAGARARIHRGCEYTMESFLGSVQGMA